MTKNGRRKACSVITADFPDPGALPHTNHRELTEYTWLHRANSNLKWLSCRRIGRSGRRRTQGQKAAIGHKQSLLVFTVQVVFGHLTA